MQFSKIVGVLLIPMYIILAFFIFLNLHEIGHTITARLAGDYTAHYIMYERYASGGFSIGRNITNEALLTPLALVIVSLAGPVGTRLLAEVCQWAKKRGWNRPSALWTAL
ncbi:MAG: hypothetical protein K8I30_02245, partial [Anaerolineae bacterium]|nr:hypothetical protein [Anaerolineae bacterium]